MKRTGAHFLRGERRKEKGERREERGERRKSINFKNDAGNTIKDEI
ncbi:MAG TPA: hypothetical protein P5184_08110 [Bacteroidales bacterium]|nr:hypothetical protein [Bacteroidales bacterium]